MNTDPVTPACTLTDQEREVAANLKPGLLLRALSGSNDVDYGTQQTSYDMAVIPFLKFLDEARDGFVNDPNNEASLFEKIAGRDLELIYSVRNVVLPIASSEILEKQGVLEEPEIVPFEKYKDAINFLAECDRQFPVKISTMGKWD